MAEGALTNGELGAEEMVDAPPNAGGDETCPCVLNENADLGCTPPGGEGKEEGAGGIGSAAGARVAPNVNAGLPVAGP